MQKRILSYVATFLMLAAIVGMAACKKRIHSNAPTPNNLRMLSYNKITKIEMTAPLGNMPSTITESYRFYYDDKNRVSQIVYTGNDSNEIFKKIDFSYFNDTVYKKTTDILTSIITEVDTFYLNSDGMVRKALTPNQITDYRYQGKLLYRVERAGTSYSYITTTDFSTYTSVDGDFLRHYSDDKLYITLSSGFDTPMHFKVVSLPVKNPVTDTMDKPHFLDYSYVWKYNYNPTYIWVRDTNDVRDSLLYPGQTFMDESYHFYTENANRPGDWMWLESFTFFGSNIYQNKHLVESISSRTKNAAISYIYDSDSKITQTRVVLQDSVLNKYTMTYDIQYERF
ncbi:MAG: hypothetical protein KF744_14760 [Taibaiella sp.]|nr:hypothetical protein [Taibaiella sp.]